MTAVDGLLLDSPAARPCQHPRANHQHGTVQAYKQDGCRCKACRQARTGYLQNRIQQIAYGRWSAWVDADPVRAHVKLVAEFSGSDSGRIAKRAGLAPDTVRRLLGQGKYAPSKRLRRRTAEALYALPATRRSPGGPQGLWTTGGDP